MSGIWDLDFTPELDCEANEGSCKYLNTAEWVLKWPCCNKNVFFCAKHRKMLEAVMTGAKSFRCDHCRRIGQVADCTWEKIKT
jgi:hypothetical protein